MKITEVLKAQSEDKCICCGSTKTYPNGKEYPIRNVNIRYHNMRNGVILTLCSACANDLANELGSIDFTKEIEE